ncbi:RTA1 like protein [Geopyxis carbonaria]|nr:RTA1 like protein [Geopyxis carbonaria]
MSNTTDTTSAHGNFVFYHYTPTLIGAGIFAALFLLSSLVHLVQLARTRTWYFIPLLIGGIMEGIGYVGRALSHHDPFALPPYLMQTLLLLVAPALFAASIYMVLARLMRATGGAEYSPVRLNWVTKLFVTGDVLSFLMQSSGGGIMAGGTEAKMKLGEKIVLGGLFLQILFFAGFVGVAVVFDVRMRAQPTAESLRVQGWRRLLGVLYASSGLILVRSVFRVVEYIQGNNGVLLRNEVWLYIFDSVLMWGVMVLFNWCHPSKVVPGRKKTYESTIGEEEGAVAMR